MRGRPISDFSDGQLAAWLTPFKNRGLSFEVAFRMATMYPGWTNSNEIIARDAEQNAAQAERMKSLYDAIPEPRP